MEKKLEFPPITDIELLRLVIDSLPIPVFWKDIHSRYRGCNKLFLDYYGFGSMAEVVNKDNDQMPWRAYAEQYRQSDRRILDSREAEIGYEESQICSDGTKTWFKTSKVPLLDATAEPIGVLCYFQDITAQKEAKTALKASEYRYRSLIETTDTGYVVLDAHGCVVDTNAEYVRLSGHRTKDEIIGHTPVEWTAENHMLENSDAFGRFLASGDQFKGFEVDYQHADGRIVSVDINAAIIEIDQEKQILALCRDITERKQAKKDLREKDKFLASVLNDLISYVGILEPDGKVIFINNTPLVISGAALPDVQGTYFYDGPWWTYSKEVSNTIKRDIEKCAAGDSVSRRVETMMEPRGLRWISFSAHPVRNDKGNITHLIVEGRDINDDVLEIKQAQARVYEEKERLQITLHSIGDAVITTDASGIIDYINPVAETLTEWTLAEALGEPLAHVFTIISENDHQPCANPLTRCLEEGKVVNLGNHTALISRSGKEYSIQDSAAPIRDRDDKVLGVVLVFADITESRRLTRQLAFHASHDPLTELVNRREFETRLRRSVQTSREQDYEHTLCYLDLDRFKIVNDTCGHVAGDELLRQIALLLNELVRSRDTVARLGGDEFGILMEHCTLEQTWPIAEEVRQAINNFGFTWHGKPFNIGVCIGVVSIVNNDKSSSELLSDADAACYAAKRSGRDRIHIYQDDDGEVAKQRNEIKWLSCIHQALECDQFCLYFQPIQSLNASKGIRYELLIRMKGDEEKLIFPATFMPVAERYAITSKIDRWVFKTAFHWLNAHPKHLEIMDHCAINLSGHSLGDEAFLRFLNSLFETSGIPPDKICLEITETAAIANLPVALKFIETLQTLGCRFALDDFGIGLSSFAYLKNLPVDFLKIDGSFVKNIVEDPNDLAIVKSINEIGHTMGKQTIAECAENNEILERLSDLGVDFAQGYGIDHPKPIEEIGSITTK